MGFDELSHPEELRRWVRDLIGLSALPETWIGLSPGDICESVASALVPMLDAELVYVWLPERAGATAVEVAYKRLGRAKEALVAVCRLLATKTSAVQHRSIANPFGAGQLHLASAAIRFEPGAVIISGSAGIEHPTEAQQLLLDFSADEVGVCLHHWHLHAGELRCQMLVNRSSDFICIADLKGKVSYVNPSGLELVGLSDRDTAINKHIRDFIAEPDRGFAEELLEAIAGGARPWRGVLRLRTFDTTKEIPSFVRGSIWHE